MWIKASLVNDPKNRTVRVNMDNIVNYVPSATNQDFTVLEDFSGKEIEISLSCEKIDNMLMITLDE